MSGNIEAHLKWGFSSYEPSLEHLLEGANYFSGIPFANLEEVIKWKRASSRPKDLKDIELIEAHLGNVV